MSRIALAAYLVLMFSTAHAQTGGLDPDSFGHNVVFLGAAQTRKNLLVEGRCSKADLPHCTVLLTDPHSTTGARQPYHGRIDLPAGSLNSLLCFEITPTIDVRLTSRSTYSNQPGEWRASGIVVLNSPVLEDRTLINPHTNLPFVGRLEIPISLMEEVIALQPGEFSNKRFQYTERCGATSSLTRQRLVKDYGLSAAHADAIFTNPVRLEFTSYMVGRMLTRMEFSYHLRVYGDR